MRKVPCCLSEVAALAGRLEVEPLLDVVFLRLGLVRQPPFCVILVDQVVVDSGRLPKRHVGVWVMDDYISTAEAIVMMAWGGYDAIESSEVHGAS
jgi:hypothetical protein